MEEKSVQTLAEALSQAQRFGLHDKWRFAKGELRWHRVTALSAKNGNMLWSKPMNYMVRPVIVGNTIIIEPRACDLRTGKIKTRIHPITGKTVPWEYLRPGHTCAATSASPTCLFYRSYNAAFYDLAGDRGITYFGAIRPGCWINMIPANGLVLFPEASAGCTCSFPLRTSVVLEPAKPAVTGDWTVFVSQGSITPVKRLGINLGAPGDRGDSLLSQRRVSRRRQLAGLLPRQLCRHRRALSFLLPHSQSPEPGAAACAGLLHRRKLRRQGYVREVRGPHSLR